MRGIEFYNKSIFRILGILILGFSFAHCTPSIKSKESSSSSGTTSSTSSSGGGSGGGGSGADTTAPTVDTVTVTTGLTVTVAFSETMGTGVTTASNYTVSGTGIGTLASNPTSVALVAGSTYLLTWATGEMFNGGNITITVANAQDSAGNVINSSGTHTGGAIGTAPTVDTVTIDGGNSSTTTTTVSVAFTYSGSPTEICIRNDTTVASCAWDADITSPNSHTVTSGSGTKTVRVWVRDAAGNVATLLSDTIDLGCPTNFALVPASATYGLSEFCVAMYEMRAVLTSNSTVSADGGAGGALDTTLHHASSTNSGRPWVNINRADASAECVAQGWTLITNNQWQAIARNVELVASNWSSGVVGTGMLPRGHFDGNPANTITVTTTTNGYSDTGDDPGDAAAWTTRGNTPSDAISQYRIHTLSNGNTVWDMAGNAWEWTLGTKASLGLDEPLNSAGNGWRVYSDTTYFDSTSHTVNRLAAAPSVSSYNAATNGVGSCVSGLGDSFTRGGAHDTGSNAGIFAASFFTGVNSTLTSTNLSFRCVSAIP